MEHEEDNDEIDADEYLDAFVALGGGADKEGFVSKEQLISIIKEEFELTIDMVVSISMRIGAWLSQPRRSHWSLLDFNSCLQDYLRKIGGDQ